MGARMAGWRIQSEVRELRHFQFLYWYSKTDCAVKSYKAAEWVSW